MTRNKVNAVSKNVVRKILIGLVPSPYEQPYRLRYAPRLRVVSAERARTSSRPDYRRDPPGRGRPGEPCLPGFAARADPESFAESSAAMVAHRRPGRSLRSAGFLLPLASVRA